MAATLVQLLAIHAAQWLAGALIVMAIVLSRVPDALRGYNAQRAFLFALAMAAALLPLFGYWLAGRTHPNAIAGLLPWNDAAGYYSCALSILDGGGPSEFCQRRPAYSFYLTGMLRLAGAELQLALLLQTILNGTAIFVLAFAAARRWGMAAGLIAAAMLASFAANVSVATLTENLGIVLGTGGLLLFLSGAERRAGHLLAIGAFALSLALNARAGAFLVLPLLVMWPFLVFDMTWDRRWRLAGIILVSAAAGFLPGPAIVALFGGATGEIHSNFSYTLYGLAAGGERWTYAVTRLPGATSAEIYAGAFELIRTQPLQLVAGVTQGFLEYLQRLLTYVPWVPARVILGACWLWGISVLVRVRSTDVKRALALCMLGVALSAPILSIDGDTRVFAATAALDGLLAALGFARLAACMSNRRIAIWGGAVLAVLAFSQLALPGDPRAWGGAMVLGGVLALVGQYQVSAPRPDQNPQFSSGLATWVMTLSVLVLILVAPWGKLGGHGMARDLFAAPECVIGSPVLARPGRDSPVLTISAENVGDHWPVVTPSDRFRAGLHPLTHQFAYLARLDAGTAVMFLHDLTPADDTRTRTGILLGDATLVPSDGRLYRLCVADSVEEDLPGARRITAVHLVGSNDSLSR